MHLSQNIKDYFSMLLLQRDKNHYVQIHQHHDLIKVDYTQILFHLNPILLLQNNLQLLLFQNESIFLSRNTSKLLLQIYNIFKLF
jgi:hypothetical protein